MLSDSDFSSAYSKSNLENIFRQVDQYADYNLQDLTWTKTEVLSPNGDVIHTSWEAYYDSATPVIKINPEGYIDFTIDYEYNGNLAEYKGEVLNCGIRYNLLNDDINQDPINLVSVAGVGTVVLDLYKGSAFIEQRSDEGYLENKYYITIKDSSKLFSYGNNKINWTDTLDEYIGYWIKIKDSNKIENLVQNVNKLGCKTGETGNIWEVTKIETYQYDIDGKDVNIELDEQNSTFLKGISGTYKASLLRYLGIPAKTSTYMVDDKGKQIGEPISESNFSGIYWGEKDGNGNWIHEPKIYSTETIFTTTNGESKNSKFRTYERELDFSGNIRQQYEIENGKYVSGIIVPEYDQYGIGQK